MIRKSNLELLRIVSMLLIIAGHFYGQTLGHHAKGDIPILIFSSGSRVAVNLFLMIGVWFMVDKKFEARRIFKIWNTVWFWSIVLTSTAIMIGQPVSIYGCITALFPILFYNLWFASAYIVLLLLAPYLNISCQRLSEVLGRPGGDKLKFFIFLLSILTIGQPTYSPALMDTWFCAISYFAFMYIIMWFYKRNYSNFSWNRWLVLFIGITLYVIMVVVANDDNLMKFHLTKISTRYLFDYKSLPNFLISSCIFYFVLKSDIGEIKWLNLLASVSFGVYVIHQIPFFRDYLWFNILRIESWGFSDNFDFYFFLIVFGIYLICGVAEYLRQLLIEKPLLSAKKLSLIMGKFNNLYKL